MEIERAAVNHAVTAASAGMLARAALVLVGSLASAACAYVKVKPDGSMQVVGFVSMTIPASRNDRAGGCHRPAVAAVSVSAVGVSWFSSPIGSSFAVGYTRDGISLVPLSAGHIVGPLARVDPSDSTQLPLPHTRRYE